MRIPNLTHGSLFMLGAYFGVSLHRLGLGFWLAALAGGLGVARARRADRALLLRRLPGAELAQVLVTLGLSFMIADVCLMQWGGDPISIETPAALRGASHVAGVAFPTYRLGVIVIAVAGRRGAVADARADAARRHDPRRRRRPGDGARRRHPRVAACSPSCSASAPGWRALPA